MKIAAIMVTVALLGTGESPPAELRLRGAKATVEDTDATPRFRIGADGYIFERVGNPKRVALAFDPSQRRVRISGPDRPALWINCYDLMAVPGRCTGREQRPLYTDADTAKAAMVQAVGPVRRRTGAVRGDPVERAAVIPECPGDPPCP